MSKSEFELTATERRAWWLIAQFIVNHGYSPTYREIQHGMGWKTPSAAHYVVDALEEKGYVIRANCPDEARRPARSLRLFVWPMCMAVVPSSHNA